MPLQAIDRAVLLLSKVDQPLTSAAQVDNLRVDGLEMGDKSKEKVKEIITTGAYRRNDYMANCERQSALQLVRSCVTDSSVQAADTEAGTVSECLKCACENGDRAYWLGALPGQQRVLAHAQVDRDCGKSCVTGSIRSW